MPTYKAPVVSAHFKPHKSTNKSTKHAAVEAANGPTFASTNGKAFFSPPSETILATQQKPNLSAHWKPDAPAICSTFETANIQTKQPAE